MSLAASQRFPLHGEVTLALVAGVTLAGLDPLRETKLLSEAATHGVVTVLVRDLSARFGGPTKVVVGVPVQLAYARSGAEEVDREDLQEAIIQMAHRDLDWLTAYGDVGSRSLHMVASGPMASGVAVIGELCAPEDAEERAHREETFVVGSDMDGQPHPRGILGHSLAFVSWEGSAMATISPDRYELLFDEDNHLYLVPSYDV